MMQNAFVWVEENLKKKGFFDGQRSLPAATGASYVFLFFHIVFLALDPVICMLHT